MARYKNPLKQEAWKTLGDYARARSRPGECIPIARVYRMCYDLIGKHWVECLEDDYERIIEKGENE